MAPAYVASLLYLPQVMQKLFGFSPFAAGVGLLPMLGTYAVVAFLVGSLAGRLSDRFAIVAGLTCLALGPFLLSGFNVAAGYGGLVTGMVVSGVGLGLFQPSSNTAAVQADDRGRKSLALGLVLMFQFVGGAIGLGLMTTIVASSERAAVDNHFTSADILLPPAQRNALDGLLAGTESSQQILQQFDPTIARELIDIAGAAFAAGVRAGLRLDAGIAAVGVVLAALVLGSAWKEVARRS
jgi:hypothetical protein